MSAVILRCRARLRRAAYPRKDDGVKLLIHSLNAPTSCVASAQTARYFVCPLNSLEKNAEAVDPYTSASRASSLLPMGSRFRQPPSAYL